MRAKRPGFGALLAALLVAAPAGAGTVYVRQEGTDSGSCGAKTTPCRSISRGIEVAGSGDTVRVGPGHYGDLNDDGAFDDPGDEAAELGSGCDCMIRVEKQVSLLSEAGAGATVIDGSDLAPTLVAISASGVVFGRANQGFTLTGSNGPAPRGALEVSGATGVSIAGVTAEGNAGVGFFVEGDGHTLSDNRAQQNYLGFLVRGSGSSLARNLASSNQHGLQIEGQGVALKDDVFAANRYVGLAVLNGPADAVFDRIQILGNGGVGLVTSVPIVLRGGSIVGNFAGGTNCGVSLPSGGALDAEGVFWGSAAGPGDDPADLVCQEAGTTADTDPPAKKPGKPKLKPLK